MLPRYHPLFAAAAAQLETGNGGRPARLTHSSDGSSREKALTFAGGRLSALRTLSAPGRNRQDSSFLAFFISAAF